MRIDIKHRAIHMETLPKRNRISGNACNEISRSIAYEFLLLLGLFVDPCAYILVLNSQIYCFFFTHPYFTNLILLEQSLLTDDEEISFCILLRDSLKA